MKKYVFKPYNTIFPALFEAEKERITSHVQRPIEIEHVGSTAVPDLGGKGIIDIAIAANKQDIDIILGQLQNLGYEFKPTFSTPDRFYLIIHLPDPEEETRRYHIHLTYPESSEWNELLGFREYLKYHPEKALEYAAMKKQAAFEANHDGEKYRKLKEPMFQNFKSLPNKMNRPKISIYIATSIDGYIARKDGGLDWLNRVGGFDEDYGFQKLLNSIDAVIIGRKTYEVATTVQDPYPGKRVVVLSNSLNAVREGMELYRGDLAELVASLYKEGIRHIWIDGGNTLSQFLSFQMVDIMTLSIIPVILGDGVPLFNVINKEISCRLISSQPYPSGLVQTIYEIEPKMLNS